MSLPKYPTYKDSGVEWLGEVPCHWDSVPLFTVLRERDEKNTGLIETNVLSLSYGRIIRRDVESNHGLLPESFETYQIVNADNIILRLTDLQNDQRSLRVGMAIERGVITSAYACLEATARIDKKFAYQLLNLYDLRKIFYGLGGGVRQSMGYDDLKRLPVFLPPLPEQRAIAAFLDAETARIDALVAKQEALIATLQEKRRALIDHAVSSGLANVGGLKPSDIPWLTHIPQHWCVKRGRYLFRQSALPVQEEDEIVTCFRNGQVTLRRNRREEGFTFAVKEVGYQGVRSGQLVLHSMDAFAGAIGVSDSDGKCTPEYIICDPIGGNAYNPYYGFLLRMMALRGFILAACPAVRERAPRIRFSDVAELLLPVPPIEEQVAIADFIKCETAQIDTLIAKAQAFIDLLREHRTALIAAAVTGQIDVRGWAGAE